MTDRDHFAAAALTGFASQLRYGSVFDMTLTAKQCYELADAMLRERDNHSEKPKSFPALTDEEREAVEAAVGFCECTDKPLPRSEQIATLRSLLERLGGER